ncbi:MAG: hypothetical protein ABI594_01245 [Ginsengibacter sp.]
MSNYLLQEYYFKLKLIGIYQIIGGLIGLGLTIWLIAMLLPMPFLITCIIIASIGFFLFSIACGIGLCFKKWIAINSSIVLQLLQIISFTLYGRSLKLISGLGVLLNLDFTNSLQVQIKLSEPLFRFTYLIDPTERIMGVNLVAILIAFFIIDLKKKIACSLNKSESNSIKGYG